jgi:hypothetical protein
LRPQRKRSIRSYPATNGKKLAEYKLDGLPVWDGIAAANRELFMTMSDGNVVGFRGK